MAVRKRILRSCTRTSGRRQGDDIVYKENEEELKEDEEDDSKYHNASNWTFYCLTLSTLLLHSQQNNSDKLLHQMSRSESKVSCKKKDHIKKEVFIKRSSVRIVL